MGNGRGKKGEGGGRMKIEFLLEKVVMEGRGIGEDEGGVYEVGEEDKVLGIIEEEGRRRGGMRKGRRLIEHA